MRACARSAHAVRMQCACSAHAVRMQCACSTSHHLVAVRLRHALLEARNQRQVLREGELAVAGHRGVVACQWRRGVLVEHALARDRIELHRRLVRLHLCP